MSRSRGLARLRSLPKCPISTRSSRPRLGDLNAYGIAMRNAMNATTQRDQRAERSAAAPRGRAARPLRCGSYSFASPVHHGATYGFTAGQRRRRSPARSTGSSETAVILHAAARPAPSPASAKSRQRPNLRRSHGEVDSANVAKNATNGSTTKKCEFWIANGVQRVQDGRQQSDVAVRQLAARGGRRTTIVARSKSAGEHAPAQVVVVVVVPVVEPCPSDSDVQVRRHELVQEQRQRAVDERRLLAAVAVLDVVRVERRVSGIEVVGDAARARACPSLICVRKRSSGCRWPLVRVPLLSQAPYWRPSCCGSAAGSRRRAGSRRARRR